MSILGDTECPTKAEIWSHLEPLLPPDPRPAGPDRLEIREAADGRLSVNLSTTEGTPIADRKVSFSSSCDRLAETIAVLVASWETDLHPEWSPLNQPSMPATDRQPQTVVARAGPAPEANLLRVSPTVGAVGSYADGLFAPGFLAGASVGRVQSLWSVLAVATGVGPRSLALGPGKVSWERLDVSLGVARTVVLRKGWLDLHLAALCGALRAAGAGFPENSTVTTLDLGASGGIRALWRTHVVEPWIGADLDVWPRDEKVHVHDWPQARTLPHLEPRVGIGVDVKIGR
jgi:hypothetical protein